MSACRKVLCDCPDHPARRSVRDLDVDQIMADYRIPETSGYTGKPNRPGVEKMVDLHGEAETRRRLTSVHGSPTEIAAGNQKRAVIGNRLRSHPVER